MRITRRHLAAAGALALAVLPSIAVAESADEAAVAKAIDDLNKAMMAADKAKLEALVSDQLSFGHSAGRIETKKDFIDVVAGKKTIYKTITISEPTVSAVATTPIAPHISTLEPEPHPNPPP